MLKRELQNHSYPFPIEPGTGSVEYVATKAKFRGKGVASTLIKHIVREGGYTSYVLDVADTNTNAFRLYEALGFREFMRVPHKYAKQSGINYTVYMKYGPISPSN
jgi:ribosomal protein S18 acetylase RimI-like enzyme